MMNNHYYLFRRYSLDASQNQLRAIVFKAGGDPAVIDELIKLDIIQDYKMLLLHFENLFPGSQQETTDLRFFLCLSGEVKAFHYAIDKLGMDEGTVNKRQENALHYAALSSSTQLIDIAINTLHIPWHSESSSKMNILHYAILSRSVRQIDKVLTLEKQHGKKLSLVSKKSRNILHLAASTGDPQTVEKALEIAKERKLNPKLEDAHGFNALNYAIFSNNQRVIKMFTDLGLEAKNQEQFSLGEIDERQINRPAIR